MNEWPSCNNCRHGGPDGCAYVPWHPFVREAADLGRYGCCGYWHSSKGETIRKRCDAMMHVLQCTRPPERT